MIARHRGRKSKPLIMTNLDHVEEGNQLQIRLDYLVSLEKAGAVPVCVPPNLKEGDIALALEGCDGVLLIGGKDYDPQLWGGAAHEANVLISKTRQDFDVLLARYAVEQGLPVFGICGGQQLLNILAGGTLYTNVETQRPGALVHRSRVMGQKACHEVAVDRTGRLFAGLEAAALNVNSFHHQAVKDVGAGLRVVARATDGVIEGIEGIGTPVFGVQWHPEIELNDPLQMKLFQNFVDVCAAGRRG
jgi:putative glutamine amidotransferase